jgi:hypothetical protein
MTFFYDLNKRLKEVLEAPKSVHQKLNEGAQPATQQLNERDMSRAAKGYEKYGKEGMEALAKAGREGKALDPVRAKYDKYKDSVEEDSGDYSAKKARAGKDIGKPGKNFEKIAKDAGERYGSKAAGERVAGAVLNKLRHPKEGMEEGFGDVVKKVGGMAKKVGGAVLDKLGHGSDEDLRKDLQRKMGLPPTGKKPRTPIAKEEYGPLEEKLVGGQKKLDKNNNGKLDASDFAMLRNTGKKQKTSEEEDLNPFTNWKKPRAATPRTGEVTHGAKHDTEWTATGRKVTRRVDPQGMSVGSETDAEGNTIEKRGRGRPKGAPKAPERTTAKAYKHKGSRVAEQGEEELDEKAVSKKQQKFMGMVHAAQKGEKPASKEVAKVAKTMKKSDAEDFAATKHKGLPEKVKSNKKEKTEEADTSPTNAKGVQYGKGIYDSLNREIENLIAESMSVNLSSDSEGHKNITVTASDEDAVKLASILKLAGAGAAQGEGEGGCGCGQTPCGCGSAEKVDENQPDWPTDEEGTQDAMMYSGGMNGPKSTGQSTVPVLASQEDRQRTYEDDEDLRRMTEMSGIQQDNLEPWERTMKEDAEEKNLDEAKEMCEVCEGTPCKCDESMAESLARFRSLAGIQEAAKPDYIDLDKDGDKKESMKKAADDKEKEDKKVDESIFKLTNLWKAYKG